jgi:hypothetical protein
MVTCWTPARTSRYPRALPIVSTAAITRVTAGGALSIGNGNAIALIPAGGLQLDLGTMDVVTGNTSITGLGAAPGRIDGANVFSFSITGASLFVGEGGALSADRSSIVTTGAVGFSLGSASFKVSSVSKGTTNFTGLEAAVTNAALIGVDGIDVRVSGAVKLNKTSMVGGPRINWVTATDATNDPNNLITALTLTSAQELQASGSASLDIGGNVVAVIGSLNLDIATANVTTGNPNITGLGATAGRIDGARVLAFTISGASLFVGEGGALDATRTGISTTGAVGFWASGASFSLATVSKGTTSFTGLEVTVGNASLVGISGVDIQVSGAVKLNKTSVAGGPRIDWAVATNASNDPGNLIPALTLGSAVEFQVSASASVNLFGLVVGSADFEMVSRTVNVDQNGNGIFSLAEKDLQDATLLSIGLSNVNLDIGSGGVGFQVTSGSLGPGHH